MPKNKRERKVLVFIGEWWCPKCHRRLTDLRVNHTSVGNFCAMCGTEVEKYDEKKALKL